MSSAAKPDLEQWRQRAFGCFLVVAGFAVFFAFRDYVFEDAYITFRYAAQLAAGHGFVFQPGERVLGTSAPLLTLLLAAAGRLGVDIPTAGTLLSALGLTACAFLGARLLARRGAAHAGVIFALATLYGCGGVLHFPGMETGLHLALIFLAFFLTPLPRPWLLGLVLGLICLNRYDGVMVVAAVLLVRLLALRRLPWREALLSGALFGSWLLFAQLYFGDFLPNTYAAKADDVPFLHYLVASLDGQARQIFLPWHGLRPFNPRSILVWLLVAALFLPLILRALHLLWRSISRRRTPRPDVETESLGPGELAAPAVCALFLWLGYSAIGPPLGHRWYLIPAAYGLLLLALDAWARLPIPAAFASRATLVLLGGSLLWHPLVVFREARLLSSPTPAYERILAYEAMARFTRKLGLEHTTVLTLEPGYLTYRSGQRAIDAAGLVTPGIRYHGPQERRDSFDDLLARHRPEMAVRSSVLLHEKEATAEYLPISTPTPGRNLWLRRDVYLEHLARFYDAWQNGDFGPWQSGTSRHPLAIDGPGDENLQLFLVRSRWQKWPRLHFGGELFREKVLTSGDASLFTKTWSEPFLIDFDELELLFYSSHETQALFQLYVDGLLYQELGGEPDKEPGTLRRFRFPVHAVRGRRAMLVWVSGGGPGTFFASTAIHSRRWSRSRVFDDFESATYDPAIWSETFAEKPADNLELAGRGGLVMAQGRRVASSLSLPGRLHLRSRPFGIDHRYLSFSVFDFGNEKTRIELTVEGNILDAYTGKGSSGMAHLTWDLGALLGKEAVLTVIDDAPAADVGIAIDSIVQHDDGGSSAK